MKRILLIKCIMILTVFSIMMGLNYVTARLFYFKQINLQKTYIASRNIPPRTKITADDLLEMEIAADYILPYAYLSKEDIIGKYTDIQGMIPAGSVFYKSMLKEENELPDHAILQLKEGQSAYVLETDITKLGSIIAGQRVDVHVSVPRKDETPLTGILLENARVISIKDHKGLSLDDPEGTGVPYFVELAVKKEQLDILTLADSIGEIRLFSANDPYNTAAEAEFADDSPIVAYLQNLDKTKEEKEKKNDL